MKKEGGGKKGEVIDCMCEKSWGQGTEKVNSELDTLEGVCNDDWVKNFRFIIICLDSRLPLINNK